MGAAAAAEVPLSTAETPLLTAAPPPAEAGEHCDDSGGRGTSEASVILFMICDGVSFTLAGSSSLTDWIWRCGAGAALLIVAAGVVQGGVRRVDGVRFRGEATISGQRADAPVFAKLRFPHLLGGTSTHLSDFVVRFSE